MIAMARALISGVQSITSFAEKPWRSKGGGLVGKGWVGAYHSPGTLPASTLRSSIGQSGRPVTRSKTKRKACLVGSATALTVLP
jgi:hypothetical protein